MIAEQVFKRSRRALAVIAVGALGLAAVGCGSSDDDGAGGGSGTTASVKGKSVFIVSCTEQIPFCHAYNENMKQKLEAEGVEVTVLTDPFDPSLQNQHMNQAIARKADAIILNAANSSAIVPAVQRAEAAGVKVVNTDAPLNGEGETAPSLNVVADHVAMGRFAAEGLIDGLQQEGVDEGPVFVAAGALASKAAQQRLEGFRAAMQDHPEYEIVAVDDTSWDQNKATQVASQRLAQYRARGGLKGAYGMNDLLALGVIKAAQQAGIPVGVEKRGLVVVGGNCLAPGIPAIRDGTLHTSGTQTPVPQGNAVVEHTLELLAGKSQPRTVTVEEYKITRDNVDRFAEECTF